MADWNERFRAAVIYLGVAAIAHLAWETLQLPLYTIWSSAARWEIAFAVIHCTVGDIMIASSALIAAILVGRFWSWPCRDWKRVAVLTIIFGLSYTAYSEWFNVYVRYAWAYSASMPVVRIGGIELGLSPLLQWLIVPSVALASVRLGMPRDAPG
ncbi:MAG: hypothetical protein ACKVP4_01085 [Hyphomicrobium sp.]